MLIALIMFSLAGIPPLAGFFGKFYIFVAAIESEMLFLAIIGVIASVISAFYYLRIVKIMYFDEPKEEFDGSSIKSLNLLYYPSSILIIIFFIYPSPLINISEYAIFIFFASVPSVSYSSVFEPSPTAFFVSLLLFVMQTLLYLLKSFHLLNVPSHVERF